MHDLNRHERRSRAARERKPWSPNLYPPRFFPFALGWLPAGHSRRTLRKERPHYVKQVDLQGEDPKRWRLALVDLKHQARMLRRRLRFEASEARR